MNCLSSYEDLKVKHQQYEQAGGRVVSRGASKTQAEEESPENLGSDAQGSGNCHQT